MNKSFSILELEIIRWAEARGITQHAKPIAQVVKTVEEVSELLTAVHNKDINETKDAIGDVMVTLIILSALLDTSVVQCLNVAYEQIKDRKGYLNAVGIFIKETV